MIPSHAPAQHERRALPRLGERPFQFERQSRSRSTTRRRRPAAGSGSRASSRSWKAGCTSRRSSGRSSARCRSASTTRTGSRTRTSTSSITCATSRCRSPATGASSASRRRASTRARSTSSGRSGKSTSSRASTASSTCRRNSFALLTKLHHAAIDVEQGTEIITLLHDTTPQPPKAGAARAVVSRVASERARARLPRRHAHGDVAAATGAPDRECVRSRRPRGPRRSRASCCSGRKRSR